MDRSGPSLGAARPLFRATRRITHTGFYVGIFSPTCRARRHMEQTEGQSQEMPRRGAKGREATRRAGLLLRSIRRNPKKHGKATT